MKKRLLPLLLSFALAIPATGASAADTIETVTMTPANASISAFKVAGAIETDREGAEALKSGITGPQIQINIADIDTTLGADDAYKVTLDFENIELNHHVPTITDSPLIKVIRNTSDGSATVIGTGDILEAEAEDTKINLVIKENGYDFAAGDKIIFSLDNTFCLTKSTVGTIATVAVSGGFGDSEAMKVVSVLPKAFDIHMDGKIVSVPETETVDLKRITIESVVGNFQTTDEIRLKLSDGFEFTKVPAGAFDVTANSFKYLGNASDTLIFAANTITIQATTAKTDDIATLSVSCSGYEGASVEVAVVGENGAGDISGDLPSGSSTATFKIVNALEVSETDAKTMSGIVGPQLQIQMKDVSSVIGQDDSYEVRLRFDNIELRHALQEIISCPQIKILRSSGSNYTQIGAVDVMEAEAEDTHLDLIIRENGVDFIEGDLILFPFDTTFALTGTKVGTEATVSVSGDFGESEELVVVSVLQKALNVQMDGKTVSVPELEIASLKKITIESVVGNFVSTDEIKVSLSNGFKFVKYPAGAFNVEDDSFSVTGYTEDSIVFAAEELCIETVTAKADDVATLHVSCNGYESASVEVAVVGDGSGTGDSSGSLPSGSSSASFKIVDTIEISADEAKNLPSVAGPQIQIQLDDISSVIGQNDSYEVRLEFENIELAAALNDIIGCDQIKVLRSSGSNYIEIGTADVLAAEAEDTRLDLVIHEEGVDFAAGDLIVFSLDNAFVLTRTTEGTVATVTVSGDFGESEALPVVSVLAKALNINAAGKPVTIAPEGTATLKSISIASVVGNFTADDEITVKLGNGFVFTKYPTAAYDTTENSFAVTGYTGDSIEFAADEIEIQATTAAVDDVATLTASCSGYDSCSTEVAVVNDGSSDPEISGTFKVVGAIEVNEKDAAFLTNGIGGPQIQIKMLDVNSALGKNDKFEVTLDFENLELKQAILDETDTTQIRVVRYTSDPSVTVIATGTLLPAEAEDTKLQLEITENGIEFQDGDVILIALDNLLGLTKTAEGTIATVTVSGDFGESDALPMVSVVPKALEVNMAGKIVHTAQETIVALKKITIESVVGNFQTTDEIKINLTNGFEFTRFPIDAYDITPNSFTVSGYNTDQIVFEACMIELEPVTAKPGDIATLTASCKGYESDSDEVAEVIATAVILSVDEDEDIPAFYSGTDPDDRGLTSEKNHKSLSVTIAETTPDAWDTVDAWNLTLPEGIYVTDMTATTNGSIAGWKYGTLLDTFKNAYTDGNYQNFAFPRRSFEIIDDRRAELQLTLTLVAEPTFSGDVVLTLTGEGISEAAQEVVIAKFKPSYTVETTQTNTTITGEPVSTADITITEAEPGLWNRSSKFLFHFADTDLSFADGSTMQLQGTNPDGAISPLTDGLGFTVTTESDETAAKVVLTGLKAEATHYDEGKHDLLLTTDMMEYFLQTDLFSTQENVTIGSILGNDPSVTVKEEYLNMEDISFTTEYYLESEAGDGTYVLDHTEKVACPAGISVLIPEKTYDHFTENTSKGVHSGSVKADGSLVLSRYYDRVDYSITYHTNGGTEISALTAKYGTPITLAEPTRYGYVFDGWYADEALATPFDSETMPANGADVYAKWISVSENRGTEYTIDSIQLTDGNGNYITSLPQEVIYAEVSVTNTGSKFKDTTILAAYSGNQLVSLHYMSATTRIGDTVTFGATIDNTDGKITTLKSFVVPLLNGVPLAQSFTFGKEL